MSNVVVAAAVAADCWGASCQTEMLSTLHHLSLQRADCQIDVVVAAAESPRPLRKRTSVDSHTPRPAAATLLLVAASRGPNPMAVPNTTFDRHYEPPSCHRRPCPERWEGSSRRKEAKVSLSSSWPAADRSTATAARPAGRLVKPGQSWGMTAEWAECLRRWRGSGQGRSSRSSRRSLPPC